MIEREKHRTRGGEWTLSGVRLEEKKSAEQWKEMRNLFEWFWIIDKFQWFFFLASHRQWILSKTCDNFTILKHKHNHKYKCSKLNATPLILHLDATQSHAYEMCVRRSFFLSSYWKASSSSSNNGCNRSNVLVPFFHVIPISEHWLNLRSRLLLLFYRKLCFFSLLQCIWNVTCLFCLVLRHWFRCKILGAHNEPFGLRLKTWLLCDFSRCFFSLSVPFLSVALIARTALHVDLLFELFLCRRRCHVKPSLHGSMCCILCWSIVIIAVMHQSTQ